MLVWGVSEGQYSDYGVIAIFSSRKKAEAYLVEYLRLADSNPFRSETYIEEFDFDPDPPKVVTAIKVNMAVNGDVLKISERLEDIKDIGFVGYNIEDYLKRPISYSFSWVVHTDSQEQAIKVANEKRAMLIAANVWGDFRKTREVLGYAVT